MSSIFTLIKCIGLHVMIHVQDACVHVVKVLTFSCEDTVYML